MSSVAGRAVEADFESPYLYLSRCSRLVQLENGVHFGGVGLFVARLRMPAERRASLQGHACAGGQPVHESGKRP